MIKLLILDIDGTLTDGKINISADGELFKAFDVKDGFAIYRMLPFADITPVVITGRQSKIVERRCAELGVSELHQNVEDKASKLIEIAQKLGVVLSNIAYIGDDLNDYAAMRLCGFKACPSDAVREVRDVCDYVSPLPGGHGAVRDVCEVILQRDGLWEKWLGAWGIGRPIEVC